MYVHFIFQKYIKLLRFNLIILFKLIQGKTIIYLFYFFYFQIGFF